MSDKPNKIKIEDKIKDYGRGQLQTSFDRDRPAPSLVVSAASLQEAFKKRGIAAPAGDIRGSGSTDTKERETQERLELMERQRKEKERLEQIRLAEEREKIRKEQERQAQLRRDQEERV